MIACLHSYRINDEENSHEEKIIMDDDAFVHNIYQALTTNLLACQLQSPIVKRCLHRKCMENI